jgi:hypothetical protein
MLNVPTKMANNITDNFNAFVINLIKNAYSSYYTGFSATTLFIITFLLHYHVYFTKKMNISGYKDMLFVIVVQYHKYGIFLIFHIQYEKSCGLYIKKCQSDIPCLSGRFLDTKKRGKNLIDTEIVQPYSNYFPVQR